MQTILVRQGITELTRHKELPKIVIKLENRKPAPTPRRSSTQTASFRRIGQFAVAAVFLAISLFGFRFYADSQEPLVKRDPEVKKIETRELPDSNLYAEVFIRRDQMISTVSQNWAALSNTAKHEALQKLFDFGKARGIKAAVLMNKTGLPVGSVSDSGLIIESNT